MSIYSLADPNRRRNDPEVFTRARAFGTPTPTTASALAKFIEYIPGDVLGLYIAAWGLLHFAADDAGNSKISGVSFPTLLWWNFGVWLVITVAIVLGRHVRDGGRPFKDIKHWPWWMLFAAPFSYLFWTIAVPETPFKSFGSLYSPEAAAALAIFASAVLTAIEGAIASFKNKRNTQPVVVPTPTP